MRPDNTTHIKTNGPILANPLGEKRGRLRSNPHATGKAGQEKQDKWGGEGKKANVLVATQANKNPT